MSLICYIREGKIELLCQKNKISTKIRLKTRLQYLINKAQLEKYLEFWNRKRSAIIIIIIGK